MSETTRCAWVGDDDLGIRYHDREWGIPQRKDDKLFEALVLEGAQAGLSWSIVLRKREAYREAFEGFDPERVARFRQRKIESCLKNAGLVRHRGKLESVPGNARALLEVAEEHGSFAAYAWSAVGGAPVQNRWRRHGDLPSETEESRSLSKDMKKRGFRFVGPTIVYAFMEAVGMVNDHTTDCFRHADVAERGARWRPINPRGSRTARSSGPRRGARGS